MPRPRTDIQPRIVAAARTCFLKSGVDAASLRQIAKQAGTSVGMVYYYYPTKDELFLAVVQETYSRILVDLERALSPSLPVKERLLRMYTRIGELSVAELEIVQLVIREVLTSPARLEHLVQLFQGGHLPLIQATLKEGFSDGTFNRSYPPALALLCTMALGSLPQLVRKRAGARGPIGQLPKGEALSNQLIEVLFRGIGSGEN